MGTYRRTQRPQRFSPGGLAAPWRLSRQGFFGGSRRQLPEGCVPVEHRSLGSGSQDHEVRRQAERRATQRVVLLFSWKFDFPHCSRQMPSVPMVSSAVLAGWGPSREFENCCDLQLLRNGRECFLTLSGCSVIRSRCVFGGF